MVKICLPMQKPQEMRVRSLGQEDPLEEGMAPHSSILAWRIPWTEEPGRTRQTFVGKVMSLLLNILSRLVITFLPRSKHLLIIMAAITICSDFEAPQNKV